MRIKLYNACGEHMKTFAVWEKNFAHWLDDSADAFFTDGGYTEIWNDREVFCFEPTAQSRSELKRQIRARAT